MLIKLCFSSRKCPLNSDYLLANCRCDIVDFWMTSVYYWRGKDCLQAAAMFWMHLMLLTSIYVYFSCCGWQLLMLLTSINYCYVSFFYFWHWPLLLCSTFYTNTCRCVRCYGFSDMLCCVFSVFTVRLPRVGSKAVIIGLTPFPDWRS